MNPSRTRRCDRGRPPHDATVRKGGKARRGERSGSQKTLRIALAYSRSPRGRGARPALEKRMTNGIPGPKQGLGDVVVSGHGPADDGERSQRHQGGREIRWRTACGQAAVAERLLLVRHGACEGGGQGRLIGRQDPPLSAAGRAQSCALRSLLPAEPGMDVVCSPLRRAEQTACLALSGSDGRPRIDEMWREIDFGAWDGLTFAEAAERDPDRVGRWAAWEPDFAFPDGESLSAFVARADELAERVVRAAASTVIAVTHAGLIRVLLCRLLGLPLRAQLCLEIPYASVATVEMRDGMGVLTGLTVAVVRGVGEEGALNG